MSRELESEQRLVLGLFWSRLSNLITISDCQFKLSGTSVGGKISDILLVTTVTNCVLTIMFCPLFRIISLFYCYLTDLQLLHSKFPTVIEEKVKYLR